MGTPLTKRLSVRFTSEDEAWIAEQAADEGVDNATFVRMLVNRLRRGRPALMRDALAAHDPLRPTALNNAPTPYMNTDFVLDSAEIPSDDGALHAAQRIEDGTAEQILARRLAENPQMPDMGGAVPNGNAAAQPIVRIERSKWNPGRSGYG